MTNHRSRSQRWSGSEKRATLKTAAARRGGAARARGAVWSTDTLCKSNFGKICAREGRWQVQEARFVQWEAGGVGPAQAAGAKSEYSFAFSAFSPVFRDEERVFSRVSVWVIARKSISFLIPRETVEKCSFSGSESRPSAARAGSRRPPAASRSCVSSFSCNFRAREGYSQVRLRLSRGLLGQEAVLEPQWRCVVSPLFCLFRDV